MSHEGTSRQEFSGYGHFGPGKWPKNSFFAQIESMSDEEVWRTIYGVESKSRRKRARIKEEIDNGIVIIGRIMSDHLHKCPDWPVITRIRNFLANLCVPLCDNEGALFPRQWNFSNKPGFCVKPPYFVNQIDPTEFEESSYPGATPDERKRLRQQKWQSEHFPYKPPLPRYDLPEFTRLYHIFITYKSRQKEVIDEVHREQQNGEKFDWKDEKLSVIARNFPNHYHLPAAESRFHQAHAFFRKLIEAAVEILYGHTVTWRNEEDDQKKSGVSTSTRHLFSQKRCAEESEPQVVPSKKPSPIPPTSQFEHPKPPQFTQWNVLNVRRTNAISWRIKLPHIRQIPITYSPDGEIRDPRLRNISAISTTLARNLAQSSSSGNLENDDEIELLKTIQYIELSDDEQEEEKPSIIHKEEELEKRPRTLEDDNPGPDETDDDMEDSRSTGEEKEEEEEEWQKNCKTPDDDDDYPGSEATQTNSPVSEDDDDMFPASVPAATTSMPLLAVSRKNTISEEVQETQDVLDLDFEQILLQLEAEEKLRELAKKKSASFDTDDEDDFFPTTVPTKLPALAAVLVSKEPDEVPSDVHLAAKKEPEDITIDVSPPRFSTSSTCSISPMDENMAPTPTPSPPAQPTLVSFRISNPRIAKMGMWKSVKEDDVKALETKGKTELPEFEYGHRKRWWHMLGEPRQIEEFIFGKLATKFQLRVTHRLRMKMIISMIHQNRNEIITDRTLKCLAAERFHKFKKSRTEVPIEEVAEFVTDMMNDVFLANIDGRDEFLVDSHWKKFDPRILLDPYNPPKTHSRLFWLNIDDINNEDVSRIQWNVQIMCRKLMADLVRTVFVAKHDRRADKFCFFFNGKFDFPEKTL